MIWFTAVVAFFLFVYLLVALLRRNASDRASIEHHSRTRK